MGWNGDTDRLQGGIWDREEEDGRVSSSMEEYGGNNMGAQNKGGCHMLVKGGIW